MSAPILPGATLGVVGGGQLGRMFVAAAHRMGYRVAVLTPEPDGPAAQVADHVVHGRLDDPDAVRALARRAAVVTVELEDVDVPALATVEPHGLLRPGLGLLGVARDRRREKETFARLGLPLPAVARVEHEADLAAALRRVGGPAILKTALSGYDGRGQRRIATAEELARAWSELGRRPCVLEAVVPFAAEVSVVGARGHDGALALYEPFQNAHADHVLDVSVAPAALPPRVAAEAQAIARALLEGLDVVGVLCVELFLLPDDRLLVNEIAPRPHNSGHLTIEGHATSQFEQQVRAACGLPLGSCERVVPAVAMANLLGALWEPTTPDWSAALATPGVSLHLYGKVAAARGRKMGHVTAEGPDAREAERRVRRAREQLRSRPGAAVAPG